MDPTLIVLLKLTLAKLEI